MVDAEPKQKEDFFQKVDCIYPIAKLDYNSVKSKPILKPIAEANKMYINNELVLNRALFEYDQIEKELNEMVEKQPKYSETILFARIEMLRVHIKQIIHSLQLQKQEMKDAILEMLDINDREYGLYEEDNINQEPVEPEPPMLPTNIIPEKLTEEKGDENKTSNPYEVFLAPEKEEKNSSPETILEESKGGEI